MYTAGRKIIQVYSKRICNAIYVRLRGILKISQCWTDTQSVKMQRTRFVRPFSASREKFNKLNEACGLSGIRCSNAFTPSAILLSVLVMFASVYMACIGGSTDWFFGDIVGWINKNDSKGRNLIVSQRKKQAFSVLSEAINSRWEFKFQGR